MQDTVLIMNTAIIIDPDYRTRRLIASILQALDFEIVGTGETSIDALPLYREHTSDLVLLDINMPNTDGIETLTDLLSEYPSAYVVILTARADATATEAKKALGARDFLQKDSSPQNLRVNIERVLRGVIASRTGSSEPSAVPVRDYNSSLIEILESRSSVRSFTGRHVPDTMLLAVLSAAQHAPTSSNMQAYSFVVVRDPKTKMKLAKLAGGQDHVAKCPVFVAICADIHRLENAIATGGGSLAKGHMEMSMVAIIDAALVGMSASLVAESLELGGCMIGGMRNQPEDVARVLDLPNGVFVAFGMTLGFPSDRPPSKPRYPDVGVVHWERYEEKPLADLHQAYNTRLEDHKRETGRADGVPWTERLAKSFSEPKRLNLKHALHNLGYDFD